MCGSLLPLFHCEDRPGGSDAKTAACTIRVFSHLRDAVPLCVSTANALPAFGCPGHSARPRWRFPRAPGPWVVALGPAAAGSAAGGIGVCIACSAVGLHPTFLLYNLQAWCKLRPFPGPISSFSGAALAALAAFCFGRGGGIPLAWPFGRAWVPSAGASTPLHFFEGWRFPFSKADGGAGWE